MEKKVYKRTFMTDIWRKIFALVLAVMTWFLVSWQLHTPERVEQVRLILEYDHDHFNTKKAEVRVPLLATSLLARKYRSEDFLLRARIVPANADAGKPFLHTLDLARDVMVEKKPFLTKISFDSTYLEVEFDVYQERDLPVQVRHPLRNFPGYHVTCEAEPARVRVRGLSADFATLSSLQTNEVDIPEDCRTSFSVLTAVRIPDTMRFTGKGRPEVVASVQIQALNSSRTRETLWGCPVRILHGIPWRYAAGNLSPCVDIQMQGRLTEQQKSAILPYVDLTDVTEAGTAVRTVHLLNLPPGVTAKITPAILAVPLTESPANASPNGKAAEIPPASTD